MTSPDLFADETREVVTVKLDSKATRITTTSPAQRLDDKGRCCGIKPLNYKRAPEAYRFCHRCDRAYDANGEQMPNWAWRMVEPGVFENNRHEVVG